MLVAAGAQPLMDEPMTEPKVLRMARGVSLNEMTLPEGGSSLYVVNSRRTPESLRFTTLAQAEAAFDTEVARCTYD